MTTYPVYLKFGENLKFFRNLSAEEARDERFAAEDIDLRFWEDKMYEIDYKYEAPLFLDGKYYFIFKEENANIQQSDT